MRGISGFIPSRKAGLILLLSSQASLPLLRDAYPSRATFICQLTFFDLDLKKDFFRIFGILAFPQINPAIVVSSSLGG